MSETKKVTGADLVRTAEIFCGDQYVLGALPFRKNAELLNKFYGGDSIKFRDINDPWDCAEFVCLIIFLELKLLYGANNNDAYDKLGSIDAWTNFFKRDYDKNLFKKISITEARNTPGAILLRYTVNSRIGHIGFSKGNNQTIEAMSRARGVANGTVSGRTWDVAFVLKEVDCQCTGSGNYEPPKAPVFRYRNKPYMEHKLIGEIQVKLKDLRFYKSTISNKYGPLTMEAVTRFQTDRGLVVDGMAGQETMTALGVKWY